MIRAFAALPASVRGIVLMLVTTLVFTSQHVMIRQVSHEVHPIEAGFFRSVFSLLVILPVLRGGLAVFHTRKLSWHVARGVLQSVNMMMSFYAITVIPLSQNVALSFTAPLYASVIAIVVLGERVEWQRLAALVVGLAGALMVIQPGVSEINPGSLFALLAALCWASGMAIIKYLARTESSMTATAYMGVVMTLTTFVPALFVWTWPSLEGWLWLFLIGVCAAVGNLCLAEAFKSADLTVVLPFDYTRIVWISVLGYVAFAEVPTLWTLAGGTVIFGAATFVAIRERGATGAKTRDAGTRIE
jgi:drug/metabolite transporter (DMT)-like permease